MNKVFTKLILRSLNKTSNTDKLISTYKAAVITEIGKPLEIQEKKVPKLKANEVRVQVVYCSVNSVDCFKFKNDGGDLPFIPGYELSGEVLEKGSDIKDEVLRNGERVVGLNLQRFGGFAEQCVLDINDIWRIPGDLERKDAAVIAYGHSTALYTFSKLSTIKEKEKVVISAGPAGMGLAAVDIAANVYKAQVIGLVDTEERGELVRQRGAFETLHFSDKLSKQCMKITGNKGANVVYDATGEQMMETIGRCVSVGGKVFHAAPYFYKTVPAPVPHSFVSIVSLKELKNQKLNLYRSIVSDTLELASEGLISAHISAKYNLGQVNDAVKFIDEKQCTGKVLIHIDENPESVQHIHSVFDKFEEVEGIKGLHEHHKLHQVFSKNPGWKDVVNISKLSESNTDRPQYLAMTCVPLTCADVEVTFSVLQWIFSKKR